MIFADILNINISFYLNDYENLNLFKCNSSLYKKISNLKLQNSYNFNDINNTLMRPIVTGFHDYIPSAHIKFNTKHIDYVELITFNSHISKIQFNLFPKLARLVLGGNFNQAINCLPNTLSELQLGDKFNQAINCLPNSLKVLQIGKNFNQKLNSLPNSLSILIIKGSFNQEINNLPNTLIYLDISGKFNRRINNLPTSLSYLKLGNNFNHPIDHLPSNLIRLDLNNCSNFNHPINNLPKNLKELKLDFYSNPFDELDSDESDCSFNQEIKNLPTSLKYISIRPSNIKIKLKNLKEIKYLASGTKDDYPYLILSASEIKDE